MTSKLKILQVMFKKARQCWSRGPDRMLVSSRLKHASHAWSCAGSALMSALGQSRRALNQGVSHITVVNADVVQHGYHKGQDGIISEKVDDGAELVRGDNAGAVLIYTVWLFKGSIVIATGWS